MKFGSKLLDRKKREQPLQTRMSRAKTPPPLHQYDPNDKEMDRWRAIQLQHKALFREKALSPSSGEGSASPLKYQETYPKSLHSEQAKVPVEIANKLPPTLSNPIDHRYIKKKLEQSKQPMPKLAIEVKPSLLETLHPGSTLLEEAEFQVARKQLDDPTSLDYESELRKTVQVLHDSALRDKADKWAEERNSLISECAALESRKQQLEDL